MGEAARVARWVMCNVLLCDAKQQLRFVSIRGLHGVLHPDLLMVCVCGCCCLYTDGFGSTVYSRSMAIPRVRNRWPPR